jgi:hypothetical protein
MDRRARTDNADAESPLARRQSCCCDELFVTSSVLLNTIFQFVSKKSTWVSCALNS